MFIRFDMIYERDRRTDGHRMTAIAALMHSIARQKLQSQPHNCLHITHKCVNQHIVKTSVTTQTTHNLAHVNCATTKNTSKIQ